MSEKTTVLEYIGALHEELGRLEAERDRLKAGLDALVEGVENVADRLDQLADQWGDEAVFRRCRDRLRALCGKGGGE